VKLKLIIPLLLFVTAFTCGQTGGQPGYTTVTATNILTGAASGPVPLPSGKMTWQATDQKGTPISYQVNGLGHQVNAPTICGITNGAFNQTCSIADTSLTNPRNLCFNVSIRDSSNKLILGGPNSGYTCVQPQGSTWSFDNYVPNIAGLPVVTVPIATEIANGMVRAPSCKDLGPMWVPQDVNTDGTWNCRDTSVVGDFTFNLENPTTLDTLHWKHKVGYKSQIQRISCDVTGSGTADINLAYSAEAVPNTVVGLVMATSLTCSSTTTASSTTFVTSLIPQNAPILLSITSSSVTGVLHVYTHETKSEP
jgi:hypothetical protein